MEFLYLIGGLFSFVYYLLSYKIPISQNIDKLDTNNWLVCCKNCNKSKGNSDYDTFLKSKILKKRILNNK